MKASTRDAVVEILDGMRTIANADMMARVGYISQHRDEARSGAVCRGHKACAIGSLFLAGGVRPEYQHDESGLVITVLPGADQDEREDFLRGGGYKVPIRIALRYLNEASARYIDRHDIYPDRNYWDEVEALFESDDEALYDGDARRKAMLSVIRSAKRAVLAEAVS